MISGIRLGGVGLELFSQLPYSLALMSATCERVFRVGERGERGERGDGRGPVRVHVRSGLA